MITCVPNSRHQLKHLQPTDYVLEIGGGHNPHPRADVVVDKYVDEDGHRSGNLKVRKGQQFIQADGESLPFPDKHFDYVICCHVLEHVENPSRFLKEMMRVSKKGYLEVPSVIGEMLAPKASHTWVSIYSEGKLSVYNKENIGMKTFPVDAGDVFLYHLPQQSFAYKILMKTHANLLTVRLEWSEEIPFSIEEKASELRGTVNGRWTPQLIAEQFPKKSLTNEMAAFAKAAFQVGFEYLSNRFKGESQKEAKQKVGLGLKSVVIG